MSKSELTSSEREELQWKIHLSKSYRNKKLKELALIVAGALLLGLITIYWIGNLSWAMLLVTLILGFLIMLVFLFAWSLAGRQINKMEMDLELGMTRTGISEIKTINPFNRTIRLEDGSVVYEGDSFYGKWRQGDKIFYKTTNSGEHLFECKRVE